MSWKLLLTVLWTLTAVLAQAPGGRWDGTITFGKMKVPFTIQLDGAGPAMTGTFVNGDVRVSSTAGTFDGKRLALSFAAPGEELEATLVDGALQGTYDGHGFTASTYCTCGLEGVAGPAIMGAWEIPEKQWRLDIKRTGEDTMVTVRGGDKAIGPMTGRYDGLTFQLHYFDGARAAVLELEERKDGGLNVVWMEPETETVRTKAIRVEAKR